MAGTGSVLFIHSRDISTPIGTTVPHYVTKTVADSHNVYVICPRHRGEHDSTYNDAVSKLYDLPVGTVPIVSAVIFAVSSAVLACYLCLRHGFDVIYAYQKTLIQGYAASVVGSARFVVGLQVVPVRQWNDFRDYRDGRSLRDVVSDGLMGVYARSVSVLLARADRIICLTDGIREVTAREYDVDPARMDVIGMGIDTDSFDFSVRQRESRNNWVITYVGTVDDTRDLATVLEAMHRTHHEFSFRVVGKALPDEYRETFLSRADELGVRDDVDWVGTVPHEEVPEILATSDIAVSPLPDIESYRVSFPAKLLEYLAAGTVVVCSDIRPHQKLICHRENGYLFDGTVDGLVDTLNTVVDEADRHTEVAKNGRETISNYEWGSIVSRHEAVIFDE